MAKISLAITPNRPNRHGECVVMLQISAHLKTIQVPTDVTVLKENWIKPGQVLGGKTGDKLASQKNIRLTQIKNGCDLKMINNQEKVSKMDVNQLKKYLLSEKEEVETNFISYGEKRAAETAALGKKKTSALLSCTLTKIKEFWGSNNLEFSEIDVRFLEKFESYCLTTPVKPTTKDGTTTKVKYMKVNGVAVYLRYLRGILNEAINDDLTENYPFRKFKIKTEVTRNRNLSFTSIRSIRDYVTDEKKLEITRDVFMLQFYLLGINTKDLFYLLPTDIIDGRIQYFRAKTGRFYNIKIEKEAQVLLDKYKGEKYLLWFADQSQSKREPDNIRHSRKTRFQYKDETAFTKMTNKNLSEIQEALKINTSVKITSYYCRHSVASLMRELGVSIDDISLCLGHSSPEKKVTKVYINEDFVRADEANRKLLDQLKKTAAMEELEKKSKKEKKKVA